MLRYATAEIDFGAASRGVSADTSQGSKIFFCVKRTPGRRRQKSRLGKFVMTLSGFCRTIRVQGDP
jgi:hypothetical protein